MYLIVTDNIDQSKPFVTSNKCNLRKNYRFLFQRASAAGSNVDDVSRQLLQLLFSLSQTWKYSFFSKFDNNFTL